MDDDVDVLKHVYDRFNAKGIDAVLAALADDVAWTNGMEAATFTVARPSRSTGHGSGRSSVRMSSP